MACVSSHGFFDLCGARLQRIWLGLPSREALW